MYTKLHYKWLSKSFDNQNFFLIAGLTAKHIALLTVMLSWCFLGFGQKQSMLSKGDNNNILRHHTEEINSVDKQRYRDSIRRLSTSKTPKKPKKGHKIEVNNTENVGISPIENIKNKQEIVEKRDYSSKHFINEDGSYTALVGAGPIHYKKNNKFYDIDHKITANNDANYPYANTTNLLESYFGANASIGVKNVNKYGEITEFLNVQMYWEVNGEKQNVQNASNSSLLINGDKAHYTNIFGNISAEFTILSGKRKLNYIIPNQNALGNIPLNAEYLVFSEEIQLPNGWTHTFDERKGIIIKNRSGIPIYAYGNPQVFENYHGDLLIQDTSKPASFEVKQIGNTVRILVRVKIDWLKSSERLFPLAIDPTVNVIPDNTVFWSGWVDAAGFGGNDLMYVGFDGGVENDAFVKFNLSTIPVGSDITAVTSSLYRFGGVGTTNNNRTMIIGGCNVDPVTAPTWLDIFNGYTGNISDAVSANNNVVGYKTNTFDAVGLTYIENALIDGETSILAWPSGNSWQATNYAAFEGYSSANNRKPYLTITYIEPCNPISASASQPVICEGESTTLAVTGTAGYTYQWFDDFDADTLTGNLIGSGNSISVSPTISSQYAVLSNCGTYDFVGVAVVPSPSVMVTSPVEVQMCDSNDIIREITVSGGTVPDIVLNETFNPDSSIPWITSANVAAGGNVLNALWYVYASGPGFSSNDNSDFVLVDSDIVGPFNMESNLTSPPISLADYVAPVNLNFYHYFRAEFGGVANVQISTDLGNTWTTIQTYNTTQGAATNFVEVDINLDAYAGEPVVMLRYNYLANWDWYWAIDNVTVTGTPRPTTLSWAPFTYLYLDNTATTPYSGENVNTVYTLPENNITYTVTAESYYGCSVDVDIDVIGGVAVWDGSNWLNGSLPDIGKNVILNGNYNTDPITGSFSACNLVVNANLRVNNNYFVQVENDVTVDGSVLVETRGAFVQNNDGGSFTLSGSGTSTVNKSTALKQNWYDYTYWSSPVVDETVSGAFPNTPSNRRFWFNAQNYLDTNADDIDDNGDDWTIAAGGSTLITGLGYAATSVNIGPGFPRIDLHTFNGAFNTGDINVNVYTNTLNTLNNWNFIGNPYPSAISFYDLYDENNSVISGAAYLWSQASPPEAGNPGNEQLNFNQNDYAIITAYSGGTAGASGEIPTEFIPSGQGFFVNALNTGNVTFKNNMRHADATSNSQFFRNSVLENNRIWINLSSDNGLFSQILMAYIDGASDYFDGYAYDAPRNASVSNAGTLFTNIENQDNRKFAIQAKNPSSLSINEVIPLGLNTSINQATLYAINIERFEGAFFDSHPIYLKDNYLGNIHNLKESSYLFTSQPGEFLNRFEIVFQDQTLTITDQQLNAVSIYKVQNELHVISPNQPIKSVSVHDMLGRTIGNYQNIDNNNFKFQLDQSNGTYIISAELDNGVIITKKVIH